MLDHRRIITHCRKRFLEFYHNIYHNTNLFELEKRSRKVYFSSGESLIKK